MMKAWRTVSVAAALLAIWMLSPVQRWVPLFAKHEHLRFPYTLAFFGGLLAISLLMRKWVRRYSLISVIIMGAVVGQAIGAVSVFVAIFTSEGFAGTAKVIERSGVLPVLGFHFAIALMLGGWFFGMIAFAASKLIISRVSPNGTT